MDGMQSAPQHELPKPQAPIGEIGAGFGKEGFGHVTPELKVAPMPGERLVEANNAVSQAVGAIPTIPIQQIQYTDDPQSSQASNPVIADDSDVIEKEWVDKAKEIVARTQGDPHAKSNELTGLKKEYIQKRYGKTIATPGDETAKA
jgi:hypothetical protein